MNVGKLLNLSRLLFPWLYERENNMYPILFWSKLNKRIHIEDLAQFWTHYKCIQIIIVMITSVLRSHEQPRKQYAFSEFCTEWRRPIFLEQRWCLLILTSQHSSCSVLHGLINACSHDPFWKFKEERISASLAYPQVFYGGISSLKGKHEIPNRNI